MLLAPAVTAGGLRIAGLEPTPNAQAAAELLEIWGGERPLRLRPLPEAPRINSPEGIVYSEGDKASLIRYGSGGGEGSTISYGFAEFGARSSIRYGFTESGRSTIRYGSGGGNRSNIRYGSQ